MRFLNSKNSLNHQNIHRKRDKKTTPPGIQKTTRNSGCGRKKEANKRQNKIKDDDAKKIRKDYNDKVKLHNESLIEKTMRNGLKMSYTQLFCKEYSEKYYVTSSYIRRIIKGKSKVV